MGCVARDGINRASRVVVDTGHCSVRVVAAAERRAWTLAWTKLFLTHCGSNGQYEALYHAVPMVGIPLFAEQGWNCARAEHKGISLCLDLLQFTSDQLYDSIRQVIDNGTYKATVARLSEIWRDEPMIGAEKAGYWIDHVIKYGGSHLRSPALDLPIYQLMMLDIVLALLVALALALILLVICVKCLVRMLRRTWIKIKTE